MSRLHSAAEGKPPSGREFVMSRVFDAPRQLVFKGWTDPKHMAQWWGPHGFTNPVCELDVRPGGTWHIVMRGPDGGRPSVPRDVYREIVEPERIVWTIDHSDLPDEWHDMVNPNRPKGQGKPKLEALSTMTFEDTRPDEADDPHSVRVGSRFATRC